MVNCGGLYADRIARLCGLVPEVQIVPFRGEYFGVGGASADLVRSSIYPVPDPDLPFLGVHLTRGCLGGGLRRAQRSTRRSERGLPPPYPASGGIVGVCALPGHVAPRRAPLAGGDSGAGSLGQPEKVRRIGKEAGARYRSGRPGSGEDRSASSGSDTARHSGWRLPHSARTPIGARPQCPIAGSDLLARDRHASCDESSRGARPHLSW